MAPPKIVFLYLETAEPESGVPRAGSPPPRAATILRSVSRVSPRLQRSHARLAARVSVRRGAPR